MTYIKFDEDTWNYSRLVNAASVVYFVSDGNGNAKIGVTSRFKKRFTSLQTSNANKLKIIDIWEFSNIYDARAAESVIHNCMKKAKVYREWYNEEAVFDFLDNKAKEIIDILPMSDIKLVGVEREHGL